MDQFIENDDRFLECLIEEVAQFIRFYLGNNIDLDQIFETVLLQLPQVFEPSLQTKKAVLFREIEKICRHRKDSIPNVKSRQLELFSELSNLGEKKSDNEKQIALCRVRSFILQWNQVKHPVEKKLSFLGNENVSSLIIQLSLELSLGKYVEEGKKLEQSDIDRREKVSRYLMELLTEEEAVEVEKKFRQDPDWQRDKIWTAKVIKWVRMTLDLSEDNVQNERNFISPPIKNRLIEWFFCFPVDRVKEEDRSISSEQMNPKDAKIKHQRDIYFRAYLSLGILACLVGYFGWVEQNNKITENDSIEEQANSQPLEKPKIAELEDLSQLALIKAHETANMALAGNTRSTIRKMNDELEIPTQLLPQSQISPNDILSLDSNVSSPVQISAKSFISPSLLKKAFLLGSGYIFRPGSESLGKIVEVKNMGGDIYFQRADWPNPDSSYGLPVSTYEIRVGGGDLGFVILVGEVRRERKQLDNQNILPVYFLRPDRGWWLDKNQTRLEIDLNFLSGE